MIVALLFAVAVVFAYVLGTVAHELTHAVAARVAGAPIIGWSVYPPYVDYQPQTKRDDYVVRTSPVWLSIPLVLGYLGWLAAGLSWASLVPVGFVVGYVPRSKTDWEPVVNSTFADTSATS